MKTSLLLLSTFLGLVASQPQWCGKNYQQGQPSVNPGGQFVQPQKLEETLLNFRCWPRLQPFIEGEDESTNFIVDLAFTNLAIPGAQPFSSADSHVTSSSPSPSPSNSKFNVVIKANNIVLAEGTVPMNSTGTELGANLGKLSAGFDPVKVECSATLDGKTYKTHSEIRFLPKPSGGGGVTKQDFLTGGLLVKSGSSASYEPIIPFGFYTSWSDYLALNLSIVNAVKASGRNTIHPVPTYDNSTAFQEVLQRMEEEDVWLMYDMRGTFMNLTSVEEQVNQFKDYPNLLVWYTGDEPDGWSYPLNSTLLAGNLINKLDPYHPVSLVLNCFDYFFEEYTQGTNIIMQDTYAVDINATFSIEWGTPCNDTLGDCGCDDCTGSFDDIATRVDMFNQRLSVDGRSRGMSVWSVPQGFGNDTYWPRYPTPQEFVLQSIVGLNHGSLGIVSWDEDQNIPQPLLDSAGILGAALQDITSIIFAPGVTHSFHTSNPIDVGIWIVPSSRGETERVMVLGTNILPGNASFRLEIGGASAIPGGGKSITELLNTGAEVVESDGQLTIEFTGLGSIGFIVNF